MPHALKLSFALLLAVSAWSPARGDRPTQDEGKIELDLRRRDPASGEVKVTREDARSEAGRHRRGGHVELALVQDGGDAGRGRWCPG